ncbi:ferredoxin reductase family protein [Desulfurivibrio alkaliphilus]|uniref:Oxidoreductase FAD/NAD(P)-binding domain protein n=1 Tax=Desulfurivibrio alkaliphilus (strain DSM 19089 / UNIQEM U267 / AHT2) TaxID=589865 RepID=D6Z303_DESAT|nr:ferric reductase-like transmembrane domain-containing protein [Desulfurivibrio alkaliphilus]ADH85928.1 oxidoreductase FAD/NAD(P)-binding domain protein [Desulfurivibrio alkaliphilus AHT 2]
MRYLRSTFWIGLYFIVAVAPLLAMLVDPPPGRGFWREFSVAIGFAGLSMMGLQFFITGRFKILTAPYGIDVVYHFHRNISLVAFAFILLHAVVLLAASPELLHLLQPATAPWWMVVGVIGLLAFVVVILSSLFRQGLGLHYELWRLLHGYLSLAAVVLSVAHVVGVGYYTESPVKQGVWLVMVAAWGLALVYVRLCKSFVSWYRPYVVEEVRPEHGQSWTLRLRPEGHAGMAFKAGQFAWLTLEKLPFAIREHPFSFSSSAMQSGAVEMTIKELGDFTAGIGRVAPGTRAYLDGPYGSFVLDEREAPGFCFVAGGVGISPIMSMLRTMADRHDRRPVVLFYGSKNPASITFREELEELEKRLNLKVVHTLGDPPPDWTGERGRLSAELMARYLPENRMQLEYFICGPVPMQKAMQQVVARLGLLPEKIHSESFNFV